MTLDVARVLEGIPGWAGARFERLEGGSMNASWRVELDGRRAVLKLDPAARRSPYISRAREAAAQRQAASAGLAAESLWHSETGILTEWLPGSTLIPAELERPQVLGALAAALCQLHALPRLGHVYDCAAWARHYRALLAAPDAEQRRALAFLEGLRLPGPLVPCHNDLVPGNLLVQSSDSPGAIGFIDWEYAGDNSALFDVAALIAEYELNEQDRRRLTAAYFSDDAPPQAAIDDAIAAYRALVLLWEASRATTSDS